MRLLSVAFPFAIAACTCASAYSGDVVEFAKRIDQLVIARLSADGVQPAATIDAAAYLRRVSLDLAGRIPTLEELDAYLEADAKDRKQQLVQRLIDAPDFAFHQRNQLDILLLLRDEHNDKWREYLLEASKENRPWDQLFREVMTPEDTLSTDSRPVAYLKRRVNDIDAMTNDSSVTWFGVNIACAKCHDHPLVSDWTQAHYYGMSAFFKRTFTTRKGFASEHFDGNLKYTDVDGEEHEAELMFLTGAKTDAPKQEIDAEELKKLQERIKKSQNDDKAEPPPRPDFRPRSRLVETALADTEHRFFARNIANRIWARLLGRGIVHPLDQMHSENPPSHPELLRLLADDLHASGFDLRRLIHAIALTDVYGRSVRATSEKPSPETFAVAVPRPLSPRQLSLSLRIAGTSSEKMAKLIAEDWPKQREQLERQADGLARNLAIPDDGFQVSVSEALWFSNNQSVENDLLNASNDRLVGQLKKMESSEQIVTHAFKSVLSREPAKDERAAIIDYLSNRSDRSELALKQVVWALMTSPEFRFNH